MDKETDRKRIEERKKKQKEEQERRMGETILPHPDDDCGCQKKEKT